MINKLIEQNRIKVYLQPIISIKDKKIFAFEALTRAYDENNELISPLYLFEQASKEHLSSLLDCYVRELALEKFNHYYKKDNSLLIFLNFESSIIDQDITDNFISNVTKHNINTSNIIIEIKEDSVKDNNALKKFVKRYKELGFIIAIDDFGTGYSSFDRLSLIKPDIVKVDRSIIYDIDKNFINSEILNAISNMCHKIGALVLAEGVESKGEILTVLKKDIDIFQGFYFSKAKENITKSISTDIINSICDIGDDYTTIIKEHMEKKANLVQSSKKLTRKIINIINSNTIDYKQKIKNIIKKDEKLQAVYLLDTNGNQIGDTIIEHQNNSLYNPTKNNHDHSLKEYYFITKESKKGNYLSGKYISKASGSMCRTYSTKVNINEYEYIVCFDIIA